MKFKVPVLLFLGLAALVLLSGPASAADADKGNSHEGKIVSIAGNKLIMADKDGQNRHTHMVAADAKVTCDGKSCTLSDLKPGMRIRVTTKKGQKGQVIRIDAFKKSGTDKNK